jgi:hypothetical protein
MKRFLLLAAVPLAVVVPQAGAAEVRLFTPVTYEAGVDVPDAVKDACRVDYRLQEQVAMALKRYNKVLDTTDTLEGQVLRMTITQVHANSGAAFTGPKSLSARAELVDNGKVVNSTLLHSAAFSIPMMSFKSTCTILDKATLKIAKAAAAWVRNPRAPVAEDAEADAPVQDAASGASR